MTKAEILFEIGKVLPGMADEIMALLKRLDKDGEFVGPAREANERRFAKLCRDALEAGEFSDSLRKKMEKMESTLSSPGRPPVDEKRKNRSIKMTDTEWGELQLRAEAEGISVAEYIRQKTIAGD